jgi:hypothetical protein
MTPGAAIVRASLAGTAVFVVAAAAAAVHPHPLDGVSAAVDGVLFLAGLLVFLWSFGVAVSRSRTDELSVAGLWFLAGGSAPAEVRWPLLGSFAAECVVAIATAAARPYTPLAFGVLVPVYGLGLAGLWAARHGTFPDRAVR